MPCAYLSGIGWHFDKPLEVLALETKAREGVRPKWDIWMLRDIGDNDGYISEAVIRAMSKCESAS